MPIPTSDRGDGVSYNRSKEPQKLPSFCGFLLTYFWRSGILNHQKGFDDVQSKQDHRSDVVCSYNGCSFHVPRIEGCISFTSVFHVVATHCNGGRDLLFNLTVFDHHLDSKDCNAMTFLDYVVVIGILLTLWFTRKPPHNMP